MSFTIRWLTIAVRTPRAGAFDKFPFSCYNMGESTPPTKGYRYVKSLPYICSPRGRPASDPLPSALEPYDCLGGCRCRSSTPHLLPAERSPLGTSGAVSPRRVWHPVPGQRRSLPHGQLHRPRGSGCLRPQHRRLLRLGGRRHRPLGAVPSAGGL